jgi:PAS domain S-box-containing protein
MKASVRSIASAISRLLDVPSTDPDDARRRKLLNILLVGAVLSTILALLGNVVDDVAGIEPQERINTVYTIFASALAAAIIIFVINWYGKGWLASLLFLLVATASLAFVDAPREVANGRSGLTLVVPIMMASVLLRPWASFPTAAVSSLIVSVIALTLPPPDNLPNLYFIAAFCVVALISWLAARSLENALKELRTLNLELDQRVEQRTGELRAILDSTVDGIIVFDNNGRAAIANPATEHLLGQPPEEIVGRDIDGLMKDSVHAYDQEVIVDILKDRTAHYPSLKVRWDDKTLSMSLAPAKLDSGEDIGTVAVFHDFTQEAEVDRMKSTFLSIASHDLRSPLSAILGLTELVREGIYTSPEEKRHAIDRIYSNTQYMLSLANSLLGQAQIEAGILQLQLAPFSPANLIEGVVSAMEVLAQDKGIALTAHIADDIPDVITGDQEKLSQVLFNLLGNAIKFTNGGEVQVRAYVQGERRWALAVSDTGRGIPEDAQSIIFEPFRQVETASAAGVGLGLSIVKQLVDLMGGEVQLESEVGKGSIFTIMLPLMIN